MGNIAYNQPRKKPQNSKDKEDVKLMGTEDN